MYKIFAFIALLAAAKAAEYQASSFSTFNNNHNSVQHIDTASSNHKYASPAIIKYAAPASHIYASPDVTKYSSPVAPAKTKYAAPAATTYYHSPQVNYAAPTVAKVGSVVSKIASVAPVTKYINAPAYPAHHEEYAPAKYEFVYSVEDAHTGDFHSQQEQRDGDHVVGQYSLHEADGTVRIVKYSDEGHGFNAIVERQGHPTEAPAVYKKVLTVETPQYHQYHH